MFSNNVNTFIWYLITFKGGFFVLNKLTNKLKRKKTLLKVFITLILIIFVITALFNPVSIRLINLQAELMHIQNEISKKTTGKNYVEFVVPEDANRVKRMEVHINNYKDQVFLKDILSRCENQFEQSNYKTSQYKMILFIGEYSLDITVSDFLIGWFRYRLNDEDRTKLYNFLHTFPDYQ